ncbi:MAG: response regulator [Phycisphaerae bacterium]|nr:response regulator [Phycisphaerae bacterium]
MNHKVFMNCDDFITDAELLSQKVRELDLAKTEFLSGISQAVHSTMNGVIGMLDIVLDETVSDKIKDCLYTARSSANGLVSMMHDIVDISGIETGEIQVERSHCLLSDVLLDIESVMDSHILEACSAFEMTLVGPVPETLYTDPVRLRQCLFDILNSTARKLKSDKVTLVVSSELGTEESWLHFEVTNHCYHRRSDDADAYHRLCQDYRTRLEAIVNQEDLIYDRPSSVDLGLMVARQLSELLGGRLSFKSEVNRSLGLSLAIPFGLGSHPVKMITELSRGKPGSQVLRKNRTISFQGNVLLADDDLIDQRLIATILRKFGLNVTVVNGGFEALKQGRMGNYDIMILDMIMPDMNGSEVACRLRGQGLDIPIVTVTGSTRKLDIDACLSSGSNEHLAKPVDAEPLARVLAKYLASNDLADPISVPSDAEPCTLAGTPQGG